MEKKNKKKDPLLTVFLAATVVDTVIISILLLILATLLAVAVFMAFGLFVLWAVALVGQLLACLIRLNFFTAVGFLGAAVVALGVALMLFTLFFRLIKAYPDVFRFLKRFMLLAADDSESFSGQVLKRVRRNRTFYFVILLVLGIGCIVVSGLYGGMGPVVSFIQANFSFDGLFQAYMRMLGR